MEKLSHEEIQYNVSAIEKSGSPNYRVLFRTHEHMDRTTEGRNRGTTKKIYIKNS